MPNHITNEITSERPEALAWIKERLRSEGGEIEVDFNRLIPMPEIMGEGDDVTLGLEDRAAVYVGTLSLKGVLERQHASHRKTDDVLTALRDGNVLRELLDGRPVKDWPDEDFERLIKYMRALREHGHASWYTWAREHWGTKWNAYNLAVTDGAIRFDTAWSCPEPIVRALAEATPTGMPWRWRYADEDIGCNAGTWALPGREAGSLAFEEPADMVRFACDVKRMDYDEYVSEIEA